VKSLFFIVSTLCLFQAQAQPGSEFLTRITKSITINQDITTVFDHVKNTMNDDTWRSEVNQMQADGPFEVGTTYTEDAHIGLNRSFITKTILADIRKNQRAFYVTPQDAPYYLSSLREVERIDDQTTKFTYSVEFDSRMSKETLGINLSPKILAATYGMIMSKYLRNLKRYLQ